MAKKRFTDIEIWDKEWFMELSPTHKCLIRYLFDKCDASGCWKPNWKLASLHINDTVSQDDLKELPEDQYEILPSGKIFLPEFINFQYGTLSTKSPAHNPVFQAIEKNNLSDRVFNRVSYTLQEKDIDIDKDKEKDKDKEIGEKKNEPQPEVKPVKTFNTNPLATDFNGLPSSYQDISIELVKRTKNIDITPEIIVSMWGIFKVQKLTGNDYYANQGKVYSYFVDWIKFQNFTNEKKNAKDGKFNRSSGSGNGKEIKFDKP